MHGIRTQGSRTVRADESTELWWHPQVKIKKSDAYVGCSMLTGEKISKKKTENICFAKCQIFWSLTFRFGG